MELTDFQKDDVFAWTGSAAVWSERPSEINVAYDDDNERVSVSAEELCFINEKLGWLRENKAVIADVLMKDGMRELAEEWASGAEEAEDEEQECYIMENGKKVFLPITEADFTDSLQMDSVCFDVYENGIEVTLYLSCEPDYFAGHSILVSIEPDGTIECGSLAG